MPEDRLHDAVEVLLQLPGEPTLADPRLTDERDQAGPLLATRGMELLLEEAELICPTDERWLQGLRPPCAAALREDSDGTPCRDGRLLALEHLVAGGLVGDRGLGREAGCLADKDTPRVCRRLKPRSGVDHVARDHALALGADDHGRLPGHDSDTELEILHARLSTEGRNHIREVQGCTDGALGVVLVGDGRAPQSHHSVADELLHGPAIAAEDLPRTLEVATLELANGLRVPIRRQGGETDQVGEQHGDHAPLRGPGAIGRQTHRGGSPGRPDRDLADRGARTRGA